MSDPEWFGKKLNSHLETAKTLVLIAVILNVVGFVLALFTIVLAIIPLVWLLLDYYLIYKPLTEGKASSAETPSLVLAIVQIFTLDFISGILLLIAWIKIRDGLAVRNVPDSP